MSIYKFSIRFLIFFSFFSSITINLAAQVTDSAISSISQNKRWLEELKALPFNEQLKKINERLKSDACEVKKKNLKRSNSKEYWDIHPLFVVNGVPIDTENSKEITKLVNQLSKAQKGSVTIMDEKTQAKALFCKTQSSVVVIQTGDKE